MKTAALNNQWPKIKLNSFPQPAACERISTRGLLFWAKLSSCQAANLCRAGPSPEWRLERCHQSTAARRLHTPPRLRSPLSRSSTICIQEGYQLSKLSIISILMNDHYSKFLRSKNYLSSPCENMNPGILAPLSHLYFLYFMKTWVCLGK